MEVHASGSLDSDHHNSDCSRCMVAVVVADRQHRPMVGLVLDCWAAGRHGGLADRPNRLDWDRKKGRCTCSDPGEEALGHLTRDYRPWCGLQAMCECQAWRRRVIGRHKFVRVNYAAIDCAKHSGSQGRKRTGLGEIESEKTGKFAGSSCSVVVLTFSRRACQKPLGVVVRAVVTAADGCWPGSQRSCPNAHDAVILPWSTQA